MNQRRSEPPKLLQMILTVTLAVMLFCLLLLACYGAAWIVLQISDLITRR
jgi:uncharacterized membrane protein (DUF485 family)